MKALLVLEDGFYLEESFRSLELEPVLKAEIKDSLFNENEKKADGEDEKPKDFFHKIDITI